MIFVFYSKVWHWCLHSGHQYSFLCPNGTVFNQAVRVCDWWSNVNCAGSEQLYQNNDELYRIPERSQQEQQEVWYKADDEYRIGTAHSTVKAVSPQRGDRQRQFAGRHKSNNSNNNSSNYITITNSIVDSSAPRNNSKMTKNSFRGSMRYKSKSQSSYSSSKQQPNIYSKNSEYKSIHNSSNSRKKSNRNSGRKINYRFSTSRPRLRNRTSNPVHRNKSSINISISENNNNKQQRGSYRYNQNKFENDDELKDYISKIKNKYNIDYDHSLDEEYEIIEAIE